MLSTPRWRLRTRASGATCSTAAASALRAQLGHMRCSHFSGSLLVGATGWFRSLPHPTRRCRHRRRRRRRRLRHPRVVRGARGPVIPPHRVMRLDLRRRMGGVVLPILPRGRATRHTLRAARQLRNHRCAPDGGRRLVVPSGPHVPAQPGGQARLRTAVVSALRNHASGTAGRSHAARLPRRSSSTPLRTDASSSFGGPLSRRLR